MSNKVKPAIIIIIITVLVVSVSFVIWYVRNKLIIYDKDGMVYESEHTSEYTQGDD